MPAESVSNRPSSAGAAILGFDGDFLGQATPPDGPFEVISAGGYHTCGFRPDGEIRCWGSIVGGPDGEIRTCEPQADGASRCWTDERVNEAYRAWGGGPDSVPDGNRKVIDSGQRFSCTLWYEGSIGCWGSGSPDGLPPPGAFEAVSVSQEPRLRTATGRQHRMLGRQYLRAGQPAMTR